MVDLKVGDRVKVTHKAEHDSKVNASDRPVRRRLDGRMGLVSTPMLGGHMVNAAGSRAWFSADELTPVVTDPDGLPVEPRPTLPAEPSEHVRTITRAAEGLERERAELQKAVAGWVARCDALRAELATEREARQEADVLARQHGEALNRAQMGEGAARMQLSRVAAAVSVVRAAWGGMVKSAVDAALAALDRALAGVPAPVEAAVPLGDGPDLAALIAKVEADPLHNRGGVVSSALLVDVLRAVERRLVAVETRRPKVGPWTSPGMLHDAAGGTVASVWPCPGGWGWVANRPNLGPLNDTAETEDEAKAAALAVLSTWCDVADAPEPREP